MLHDIDNIFLQLSKWATRQGENFLTESFVVVLKSLRKWEPASVSRVLSSLTDGFLVLSADEVHCLTIETQATLACGRPDLVLRLPDCLVYIEVKEFAGLGERQLERYLEELQRSRVLHVRLVLLSRCFVEHELGRHDLVLRRWFHIGECLELELASGVISHYEARFLTEAFVGFLQSKGLVMRKVDRIDPEAVLSLRCLCVMIDEAVTALRIKSRRVADWTWMGLYLDDGQFGVGVRFENPEVIELLTAQFPVSVEAAKATCEGEIVESEYPRWTQGPYRWRIALDLSANEGEFYALSKAVQLTRVEDFIRHSREIAMSLRIPNIPPLPVQPPVSGQDEHASQDGL